MLLEIENVFGGYGNGDILKGISCSADYGDVLCLLGPNGCGKTTLFRMILGSLPVSNGKIKIAGKNISDFTTKTLANMIAYIPQYHSPVLPVQSVSLQKSSSWTSQPPIWIMQIISFSWK